MLILFRHRFSLMVLYTIVLHYIWAVDLLINPNSANATALIIFTHLLGIPIQLLPAVLYFVATLALTSIATPIVTVSSIALMLPQQITLMISAYGALHAILLGQFGDGVPRDHTFILNDQAPAILAAMGHTLAIIAMGQKWNR